MLTFLQAQPDLDMLIIDELHHTRIRFEEDLSLRRQRMNLLRTRAHSRTHIYTCLE